ncbi:hypothetical protein V7149_23105, partial [Bacillus sp. JJ1503]|uniref:hypothetical protein n=1 Tax=Bacillus sp. JJ1503 TaxID=3122956 RepID=UPI002FFD878B
MSVIEARNAATNSNNETKARVYVGISYKFSPANRTILECASNSMERGNVQLFENVYGQSFVFHKQNDQEGDINLNEETMEYYEFGYFEVNSNNEYEGLYEFNSQLNEEIFGTKSILLKDMEGNPYLMNIE